jgi:DNA-binding response OmpR family regulator
VVSLANLRRGGHARKLRTARAQVAPRVAFLARRHSRPSRALLRSGDVRVDSVRHLVWRAHRPIELTPREFTLLEFLVGNAERVLTRSELYEGVWGYDFGWNSNVLGVYVGRLRRKLEAGAEPRVIHTVRGVGYVVRPGP